MKLLLLFAATILGAALNAQEVWGDMTKLKERVVQYNLAGKDTLKQGQINIVIAPGNKVVVLPQDGMPCVVPDTRSIAVMPNAAPVPPAKDPVPGQIPNAWKRRTWKEIIEAYKNAK